MAGGILLRRRPIAQVPISLRILMAAAMWDSEILIFTGSIVLV